MDVIFLDVESSGLDGDSSVLTAFVVDYNGKLEFGFANSLKEERMLLQKLVSYFEGGGRDKLLFTWRGKAFDVPFILTRALYHGIDASGLLRVRHVDLAEFTERNFRLSRVSQERLCDFLGIKKDKTLQGVQMPLRWMRFLSGAAGEKRKIVEHCIDDVRSLKAIYRALKPYLAQVLEAEGRRPPR